VDVVEMMSPSVLFLPTLSEYGRLELIERIQTGAWSIISFNLTPSQPKRLDLHPRWEILSRRRSHHHTTTEISVKKA